MDLFDSPDFKKEFWAWFDSLPKQERVKFQNFPADLAELNFYHKVWQYKVR